MFNEKCCLLCLEETDDPIGQIDIDTAENRKLGVQEIVELYFKEELSAALSATTTRTLCRPCWEAVYTFHQFCLRVRAAHDAAVGILKPEKALKVEIDETTIKLEDVVEETEIVPIVKRRRGRPRKNATQSNTQALQIEELQLPLPECKVQLEQLQLSMADYGIQLNELQAEDIKCEALLEEPINSDYVHIPEYAEDEGNAESSISSDNEPLSEMKTTLKVKQPKKVIKQKTKRTYKKRKNKTTHFPDKESTSKQRTYRADTLPNKEAEQYISEHFPIVCCVCDSMQESFSKLQRHFRNEHQQRGYVTCCNKTFFKRSLLLDHVRVHENPQYFKCEKCSKVMCNRKSLDSHLKNHNQPLERIYKCDSCPKSFFRQVNLMQHALRHVPEDQRHFACKQCDKTFATNFLMLNHLNLVHLRTYQKICDICGKSLTGVEAMKRHMDEHAGIEQPPAKCDICGALVKSDLMLRRHKKRMHSKEDCTPQTCPICGKVSPSARRQRIHMHYVHKMERRHTCHLCHKAFRKPKELREHMTTHTGEDLYTCTYCPRRFKSNANMYAHRKKMHPKEWAEDRLRKTNAVLEKVKKFEVAENGGNGAANQTADALNTQTNMPMKPAIMELN